MKMMNLFFYESACNNLKRKTHLASFERAYIFGKALKRKGTVHFKPELEERLSFTSKF